MSDRYALLCFNQFSPKNERFKRVSADHDFSQLTTEVSEQSLGFLGMDLDLVKALYLAKMLKRFEITVHLIPLEYKNPKIDDELAKELAGGYLVYLKNTQLDLILGDLIEITSERIKTTCFTIFRSNKQSSIGGSGARSGLYQSG